MEASVANYIRPIGGNPPISDDFNEHKARGSVNPGTDYAVGKGTPVKAAAAGVVKVADTNSGGSGGRSIVIYYDIGGSGDYLHLSSLTVGLNARVAQGQVIGYSGGSANGSDSGVGAHLHYTHRTNQTTCYCNSGNVDPELQYGGPISGTQRQVKPEGPEVLRRVSPDTSQPDIDPDLQPGEVGNFDGWIHGQNVSGNDMWYRGISGNWFWSGGFTEVSPHDLADLNPPPPTVLGERTVKAEAPARFRNASNTSATVLGEYPAGSKQTFGYWQKGQAVTQGGITTDLWYVNAEQTQFSWSGGYTTQDKAGLVELPAVPIPPSQWPTVPYAFEKAGAFVTRVAAAHWSNFENQYSVPNPSDRRGFPALPTSVVDHQWGAPGAYQISSVINTFQAVHNNTEDRVSAHFVVNADEIVQMVSLADRAYHAGSGGNDYVGIEIDPFISETGVDGALTERAEKIIANVREVLLFLGERNADVALVNLLHRNIPGAATSCGQYIEPILSLIDVQDELTPEPPEPPNPDPGYKEQLDRIEVKLNTLSKHLGAS
jgi:hypothetical protein